MKNKGFGFACVCVVVTIIVTATAVRVVTVQAQPGTKKCDYTYIEDSGEPNIGKNGEIKYNDSWKAVVESGWVLRTSSSAGSTRIMYLFEKCQ